MLNLPHKGHIYNIGKTSQPMTLLLSQHQADSFSISFIAVAQHFNQQGHNFDYLQLYILQSNFGSVGTENTKNPMYFPYSNLWSLLDLVRLGATWDFCDVRGECSIGYCLDCTFFKEYDPSVCSLCGHLLVCFHCLASRLARAGIPPTFYLEFHFIFIFYSGFSHFCLVTRTSPYFIFTFIVSGKVGSRILMLATCAISVVCLTLFLVCVALWFFLFFFLDLVIFPVL